MTKFELKNLSGQPIRDTQEFADLLVEAVDGVSGLEGDIENCLASLYRTLVSDGLMNEDGKCVASLPFTNEERREMQGELEAWAKAPL